jgi:hypothetical protein
LAIVGLFWSVLMMAASFGMMLKESALDGLLLLIWSICAFYGLIVVIELLVHYWKSPWANPLRPGFGRSVVGLVMGWMSIPLLLATPMRSELAVGAYAFFLSILIIPTPLAVSLLFVFNFFRQRGVNKDAQVPVCGA